MFTHQKAPRTTALSAMRLMLVAAAGLAVTACSTGQRVVYNDGDDMYFSKEDRMPRSKQLALGRYVGDQVPDATEKPVPGTPGAIANTAVPGTANTKADSSTEDDYYNPNYRSSQLLSGSPSNYGGSRFGRSRFAEDNFRLSPVVGFGSGWGGNPMYSPFYDSWAMGSPMYGDPFWGYNTMWPGNRFSIGLNYGNMWCPSPWGGNRFMMTTAGYDPYLAGYYHTYNYNPYAPYPFMGFNSWNSGWGWGYGSGWGYGGGWNNGWNNGWNGGWANNGWNNPVQPAPGNSGPSTIKGPGQAPGAAIIGSTPVNTPFTNANGVGGAVTKNPIVDGNGPRGLNPNQPGPADVIDLNQAQANKHSHAVVDNGNLVVPAQPGSNNSYLVRPSSSMIGSTDNAAFPVYNNAGTSGYNPGNANGIDNGYVRPTRENRSNNWGNYEGGGSRGSSFGGFSGGGGGSVGGSSPNVGSTGGGR